MTLADEVAALDKQLADAARSMGEYDTSSRQEAQAKLAEITQLEAERDKAARAGSDVGEVGARIVNAQEQLGQITYYSDLRWAEFRAARDRLQRERDDVAARMTPADQVALLDLQLANADREITEYEASSRQDAQTKLAEIAQLEAERDKAARAGSDVRDVSSRIFDAQEQLGQISLSAEDSLKDKRAARDRLQRQRNDAARARQQHDRDVARTGAEAGAQAAMSDQALTDLMAITDVEPPAAVRPSDVPSPPAPATSQPSSTPGVIAPPPTPAGPPVSSTPASNGFVGKYLLPAGVAALLFGAILVGVEVTQSGGTHPGGNTAGLIGGSTSSCVPSTGCESLASDSAANASADANANTAPRTVNTWRLTSVDCTHAQGGDSATESAWVARGQACWDQLVSGSSTDDWTVTDSSATRTEKPYTAAFTYSMPTTITASGASVSLAVTANDVSSTAGISQRVCVFQATSPFTIQQGGDQCATAAATTPGSSKSASTSLTLVGNDASPGTQETVSVSIGDGGNLYYTYQASA